VEGWLGEQLQPRQNLSTPPTLSQAETMANPNLARDVVYFNWNTRKMEYIRQSREMEHENARNAALLRELRTRVLTDASQRYVPLGKDYLQAALSRRAHGLIKIVDRSNVDMGLAEQAINNNDASQVAGADCILTATMGDREADSQDVPVDGRGTVIKTTVYTQPYTFKVRDLQGNVLMSDDGTVSWTNRQNNVVKTQFADPARKLMELVTDEIAAKMTAFFTTRLTFKIKVPKGMDADDVEVRVDGRPVADVEAGKYVLAAEHLVTATLDGCGNAKRVVEVDKDDRSEVVPVKLNLKKKAAAEVTDGE